MTSSRESFLTRVRRAVAEGNRAGSTAPLEARGRVGYQGADPEPALRFRDEFTAAGGRAHVVADPEAAAARVIELVQSKSARRILLGQGTFLDSLGLAARLGALGLDVTRVESLSPDTRRDVFFAADLGITGVDFLVAETGTVVLRARPGEPRSLSLLPAVHIAVAERSQLLPDLFDLFEGGLGDGDLPRLPSCLSLITGPSKTGDIELRLVTGVHGPGEIHVVLAGV
jgi:L-lactate utilization protein LutC